jgi:hypothetical protein
MALVVDNNAAARQIYHTFTTGFEQTFIVTGNGALKCDINYRAQATTWFNNNKIMVMLITGVDIPDLYFEDPAIQVTKQAQMTTTNNNKRLMLMYYSFAFTAYIKYCQTIGREIAQRFRPPAQIIIEEIEN